MRRAMPVSDLPPRPISADRGATLAAMRNLWPYIWPHDRPDLKRRVAMSIAALVAAKIATVFVPFLYSWATNALVPTNSGPDAAVALAVATPVMLVVAYGLGRTLNTAFTQLRDALFVRISQHAVRQLAARVFAHVHALSLRYHLQRQTGGLARLITRGVNGMKSMVRHTILTTLPTILEFVFAAGIIGYHFGLSYLAVVLVMIVIYVWFTVKTSDRRITIRREMNQSDADANTKAIDALLNYETVKYFGNEAHGGRALRRGDGALSDRRDQDRHLARLAQSRPGHDLHAWHDDRDGHGRLGRRRRQQDGR